MEQDFAKRALGTEIIKWRLKVNNSTYREFWIVDNTDNSGYLAFDRFEREKHSGACNRFRVVEYAAVEQLKAENEKAYDALAGNICGYCWQKMEDEPTVKQTHQEYANQLLAENAALKSKLKIASAALEVVKVHNRNKCTLPDCICNGYAILERCW